MLRPSLFTGPAHIFLKTVLFCGLLVAALIVVYKSDLFRYGMGATPLWDFDVYWQTSRDIWHGANPYTLSYMQISGPPLVVVPFFPFALFPLSVARTLFTVMSVLAVVVTSWLLARTIAPKHSGMATLFFFTLLLLPFPTRFNFITGQPNLILMALVTWFLTTKSSTNRGWSVALQVVVKTNYLVQLFSLRRWREVAVAAGTLVLVTTFSLAIISPQFYWQFFSQRAGGYFFTPLATTDVDYYNQSVRATLARFHIKQQATVVLVSVVLVSLLYLLLLPDSKQTTLFSLLLSPLIWQHYLAVVYPVLILIVWEVWQQRRWALLAWTGVAGILLVMHFPTLHGAEAVYPANVLASHLLWGIVLLAIVRATCLMGKKMP